MSRSISHTRHLYVEAEVASAQQKSARLGDVEGNLFWAIERDLSGKGNAVFKKLFESTDEDVSIANSGLVLSVLMLYHRWFEALAKETQHSTVQSTEDVDGNGDGSNHINTSHSHRVALARKYLVAASVKVTTSPKSRISTNCSMVAITSNIDDLLEAEKILLEQQIKPPFDMNEMTEWTEHLSYPTALNSEENLFGLDAKRLVTLFCLLLEKNRRLWKLPAEDFEEERENAIHWETKLIQCSQLLYLVDDHERRQIWGVSSGLENDSDGKKRKNNSKSRKKKNTHHQPSPDKPQFIIQTLEYVSKNLSQDWHKYFSILTSNSRKCYTRPIVYLWNIFFKYAMADGDNFLLLILLSNLELLVKGKKDSFSMGSDRLKLANCCMYISRGSKLAQIPPNVVLDDICAEPIVKKCLMLYDEIPYTAPFDAEKFAKRRKLIIPMDFIDIHTPRGQNSKIDTVVTLNKHASKSKIDIASWKESEIAKSHGKGIVFKANQNTPGSEETVMSHYIKHGLRMQENNTLFDPYQQVAHKLYLDEEAATTSRGSDSGKIAVKNYEQFVAKFGAPLPKIPDEVLKEKIVAAKSKKDNKRKNTAESLNDLFGAAKDSACEISPSSKRRRVELVTRRPRQKVGVINLLISTRIAGSADKILHSDTEGPKLWYGAGSCYKGPFWLNDEKDVVNLQLATYRYSILKDLWNRGQFLSTLDYITVDNPTDVNKKPVFLAYSLSGTTIVHDDNLDKWSEKVANIASMVDSAQKEKLDENLFNILAHFLCRYLLSMGESQMDKILCLPAGNYLSVEFEQKRKRLPLFNEENLEVEKLSIFGLLFTKKPSKKILTTLTGGILKHRDALLSLLQNIEKIDDAEYKRLAQELFLSKKEILTTTILQQRIKTVVHCLNKIN